jgi:hypothetical protein
MEMEARLERKTPRFWIAVQPTIIRLYKVAGLIALTAILVGLLGFLVVNVFYFFDHTWVKPIVLNPTHTKVMEAKTKLNDARRSLADLDAEKVSITGQLDKIDRRVKMDDKIITAAGAAFETPRTPEQWVVHNDIETRKLEREDAIGERVPLQQRLASLALRRDEQKELVKQLEVSPYLRATSGTAYLAFVPYRNLGNVTIGKTKLYACSWGLINCHTVGKITALIDGEVQEQHPHDESVQRGQMVEIQLSTPSAANESVLFAGGKPLWLF